MRAAPYVWQGLHNFASLRATHVEAAMLWQRLDVE
jgi:hypothetical protein